MTPEKLLLHGKIDALHTMAQKNVGACTLIGNKRFIHTGTERRTPVPPILFKSEGVTAVNGQKKKKLPFTSPPLRLRFDHLVGFVYDSLPPCPVIYRLLLSLCGQCSHQSLLSEHLSPLLA